MNLGYARRAFIGCVVLIAYSSGCRDELAPTLRAPAAPRTSGFQQSYEWTLPISSATNPFYRIVDLPAFSEPTIVQVGVRGTILTTAHPQNVTMNYTGPIGGSGAYSTGQHECYTNVTFWYSHPSGGSRWGPGPCAYPPTAEPESADTVMFRGTGYVERGTGLLAYSGECGGDPCHTYSGSQTVFMNVFAAELRLVAAKRVVRPPEWLVFEARAFPDSIGGLRTPVRVVRWDWKAADGSRGTTQICDPGVNPCEAYVRESGTMTVTALVNGREQAMSLTIECELEGPSDPALNFPEVRDSLMAALRRSISTERSKRVEVGGFIVKRPGRYQNFCV
jgi:hypothetical protein